MTKEKLDVLIQLLKDPAVTVSELDDIMMDLGEYKEKRALNAFLEFATNPQNEVSVMDVCGESVARIWIGLNNYDPDAIMNVHTIARNAAIYYVEANKHGWLTKKQNNP